MDGTPRAPDRGAGATKRCPSCAGEYPKDFLVCPKDATALRGIEAESDPLLGGILGGTYAIERVIGEGGMARVYAARHVRLADRSLAVKVLHAEYARDSGVVERFRREGAAASAIGHPSVIEVFDVDTAPDGRPYLVTELLAGRDLGARIKEGPLPIPMAVAVARDVAGALSAAHARGIVHRDMKPENVFLVSKAGEPLRVKVLDFGISKFGVGAGESQLTKTGMILGTPAYMAPEQGRGERIDARVDIYAVGALLYACLTGRAPFEGSDPAVTITRLLTEEAVRPTSIIAAIPSGLEMVVQRAMAKDPRDRFPAMADLAQALAAYDTRAASHFVVGAAPGGIVDVTGSSRTVVTGEGASVADASAHTIVASTATVGAGGGSVVWPRESGAASRPTIVLVGFTLAFAFAFGLAEALGGLVRLGKGEGAANLSATEASLLLLGSGFLIVPAAIFFALRVRARIWQNSVKASELAANLRRTLFALLLTFGFLSLVIRVAYTVFLRHAEELGSGMWDAGLFPVSLVVGLVAGGAGIAARLFRSRES